MARPRKQVYTMEQYTKNVSEGYITNDADTQRNPAWKPIVDGLAVTILTDEYIPPIILAEEESGQIHIVDGGSRTAAFKMIRFGNHKVKSSVENPIIPYKKLVKDENGKTKFEDAEFDIRNKTFEQFPKELQKKFDEYQIETVIHENCDKEKIATYMVRYNTRKNFTANQKQFLYVPKFAEQIRDITSKEFFLNKCDIKDSEKEGGILERIAYESVMITNFLDKWNKTSNKNPLYINENATDEQFKKLNDNITRLENIVTDDTKSLFNARDSFIWFTLFDKFTQAGLNDTEFEKFLNAFVDGLRNKAVDGKQFDRVDDNGSTKDKANIIAKLHILETLMNEFLHIEETENVTPESFVAEMVDVPVETVNEEIDCYEETLDGLENNTIRDGSKLLDIANRLSLLAMVAYSYKNDVDLDDWLENYAANNNTYFMDQRKNYSHMVNDFKQYQKRVGVA
ncbi:MAG: hypothetical protein MSG78_04245 [Clostridiales bacterium]|nr:hypothetical protein [Clostridiales bacterium]